MAKDTPKKKAKAKRARAGRPKKSARERRSKVVTYTVNEDEHAKITALASARKISLARLSREAALGVEMRQPMSEESVKAWTGLGRLMGMLDDSVELMEEAREEGGGEELVTCGLRLVKDVEEVRSVLTDLRALLVGEWSDGKKGK